MGRRAVEQKLMYLILAGWAVMLLLPSVLPALFVAAGLGGAAAYIVFVDPGNETDVVTLLIKLSPIAAVAIFAAWPVGAVFRRLLRRKHSIH